ncbi:2-polyprenyl-6-methoxyphenol hydroxylase and related FAD-dependent oxidoreductases [Caldanaerovirga acetigignens]|uniref:2-polyprenyl-6-methoxyphenol hydroxylase and related FAD-dependent oxidoreductases n=1 Tax=Caldanaerovirga acetigignens TaxID=447595 RepID=A0A1M7L8S6_9FIRM|nr:FAD-dependent oxidoreductase [Caldanaerovirga acetigignens]SHM74374.1 2-polyprenyl-6-methoxyphenol hydroxylase and related FAD-dependent oxidoreductases [Caldanaerovirga acetigignens]
MPKVVVIGGGWSGCAAALAARKAGAEVVLLERTDMLLGTGLVGGIMRNNGRFTATEEMIAMGAGELFEVTDKVARHKNVEFPGHKHATLYDVSKVEPAVKKVLLEAGIEIHTMSRVRDIEMEGNKIKTVITDNDEVFSGDVFVECTGTAGPQNNCAKYGNGCAMCILRCPSYGGRVSIAAKAGVKEMMAKKADGTFGAMSGSCKLHKDSLAEEIVEKLNTTGVAVIPVPTEVREDEKILTKKACQQYALKEFVENVVLLDTGHAKLMTPYFPLDQLRRIPGFENARYEDPYAGNLGNSMRYMAMSPRDNCLKVQGVDNLFCAGEKAGPLVGHTEAICTGTLAGANAVRYAVGASLATIPTKLAVGDAIAYVNEQMKTEEGISKKYTFSGSVYFERMKQLDLYTTDVEKIRERVKKAGMLNFFNQQII